MRVLIVREGGRHVELNHGLRSGDAFVRERHRGGHLVFDFLEKRLAQKYERASEEWKSGLSERLCADLIEVGVV